MLANWDLGHDPEVSGLIVKTSRLGPIRHKKLAAVAAECDVVGSKARRSGQQLLVREVSDGCAVIVPASISRV